MSNTRVRAEIDLDAIRYNMQSMYQNLKEGTKIAAVVKMDAYGHGALEVAEAVEPFPFLWGYAVATVEEAVQLAEAGRKKPILILGIAFADQFETIVDYGLRTAVCDYEMARGLSEAAAKKNKTCRIHLKIDTGMSRIGFQANDGTAETVRRISLLPNLVIEGIFTHFARADEASKDATHEQLELFLNMIHKIEEKGVRIPLKHCSNSAGIVEVPEANLDLVRAGITLYGLWPSEEVQRDIVSLKPVMSLKSHVSFVKELPAGRSISYGGTYRTAAPCRVATIPVGYGDGYARGLSNKGYVLIRGKKAPVLGRVCMDQFMVDVTDIPEVKAGDEVVLLGTDGTHTITMEELGALSGRFNYEFACLITPRVPRVYINKR